jgi:hypothetical protein
VQMVKAATLAASICTNCLLQKLLVKNYWLGTTRRPPTGETKLNHVLVLVNEFAHVHVVQQPEPKILYPLPDRLGFSYTDQIRCHCHSLLAEQSTTPNR